MRGNLSVLTLVVVVSSGCTQLKEQLPPELAERLEEKPLPTARLEIEYRAKAQLGAVTIDFARADTPGGVLYGHRASFVAGPKVARVAFEMRGRKPETWLLMWDSHQKQTHYALVSVTARGHAPEVEVFRPSGRSLGIYGGASVQFRLGYTGGVAPLDAPDQWLRVPWLRGE